MENDPNQPVDRIENLLGLVDDLKRRVEAMEREMAAFRPKHVKFDRYDDPGAQMAVWSEKDFEGH